MTLPTFFWTIKPAGNKILYSGYPTGNPPNPSWSTVPNFLLETTSVNIDIPLTYVTPTSATVTLNGSLPTGWTYTGTNLQYNGTSVNATPTSGLYFTASYLGITANSNTFSVQGSGSSSSDIYAPTIPVGLYAATNTSTSVTIEGYTPSDPSPSGYTWSGLPATNAILIKRNGSTLGDASPTVTGQNQPTLTLFDISSPSPPSSFTQSGADVTITTVAIDPSYPTLDGLALVGQQVTGNFVASCKVSTFAPANGFSNCFLTARTNTTTGSPYVATVLYPFASGNGIQSQYRASVGGSATELQGASNSTSPVWLFLSRSGDTYSFGFSTTGNMDSGYMSLGSTTQVMGATIYVGPGANTNAGVSITVDMQQVSIQTLANWTYTDSTVSAGTTYTYTAAAQDTIPNVSAYGNSLSVTTPGTATGNTGLAVYAIGNQGSYDTTTVMAWLGCQEVAILAPYEGWQNGETSWGTVVNTIHSGSLAASGTKILGYFDSLQGSLQSSDTTSNLYTHINSNNWQLRSSWPSGTVLSWGGDQASNIYPGSTNDTNGWNSIVWTAHYHLDVFYTGNSYGTLNGSPFVNPTAAAIDGWFEDDLFASLPQTADWARTGSTSGNAPTFVADGQQAVMNEMVTLWPAGLKSANLSQGYNNTYLQSNYTGYFNYGILENSLGGAQTVEGSGSWSQLQTYITNSAALLASGGMNILCHNYMSLTGTDSTTSSPSWQALRYGYAVAMIYGLLYYPTGGQNSGGGPGFYDPTYVPWLDEFSVSGSTCTAQSAKTGPTLRWKGVISGTAPTTLASGVLTRSYANCLVLVNPYGNGSKTFTLGGATTYTRLTGYQETTVNSGGSVTPTTSITMPDRSGLFLYI